MDTFDLPEPTAAVQRQVQMANSQLALYARDLNRVVEAERQQARAHAHARLQLLEHLKTDFLSFISHALRPPLNGMGAITLLDPHADPREQTAVIALIHRGSERLKGFVQNGLEYFQGVATEGGAPAAFIDLTGVVQRVVDQVPGLTEPGVQFQLSLPGVSCLVHGEELQVAGVMRILLDNALTFSPQEKIITADVHATADRVTVRIADGGQGFPPELREELFQPFTVADVFHHSRGTGLNLALASAIVTAYGGRMRATSAGIGKGATFTVAFPRVSASEAVHHNPGSTP